MGELLIWAVFGLIVGVLAKLIMPGNDPGGIVVTMLIGIAGSIVGGYLGRVMGLYGPGQYGGFVMSIIGALLLLFLYRQFTRTRA
jgi:uncharacterized membrane protein YeaQ/YmgE (transglycosylase-associated protein family)